MVCVSMGHASLSVAVGEAVPGAPGRNRSWRGLQTAAEPFAPKRRTGVATGGRAPIRTTALATRTDTPRLLLRAQQAVAAHLSRFMAPADLFAHVLADSCELLGWDFGTAWRPDEDGETLRCEAVWEAPGADLDGLAAATTAARFRHGDPLPGAVWASRRAAWECTPFESVPVRAAAFEAAGIRTAITFPLVF